MVRTDIYIENESKFENILYFQLIKCNSELKKLEKRGDYTDELIYKKGDILFIRFVTDGMFGKEINYVQNLKEFNLLKFVSYTLAFSDSEENYIDEMILRDDDVTVGDKIYMSEITNHKKILSLFEEYFSRRFKPDVYSYEWLYNFKKGIYKTETL
jgi:hypothetical protein